MTSERWLRLLLRVMREGRWHDLSDVVVAQFELARAQLLVWTRPHGRLVDTTAATSNTIPLPPARLDAQRYARAVVRAARYGIIRPQCLARALALHHMLERHDIYGSVVRIGVRRDNDELLAHAWVELDGRILGDRTENTATFRTLADMRSSVLRRRM